MIMVFFISVLSLGYTFKDWAQGTNMNFSKYELLTILVLQVLSIRSQISNEFEI